MTSDQTLVEMGPVIFKKTLVRVPPWTLFELDLHEEHLRR